MRRRLSPRARGGARGDRADRRARPTSRSSDAPCSPARLGRVGPSAVPVSLHAGRLARMAARQGGLTFHGRRGAPGRRGICSSAGADPRRAEARQPGSTPNAAPHGRHAEACSGRIIHERMIDSRDPKNGESHTVPMSARVRIDARRAPEDRPTASHRRRQGASQAARRKAVADGLKRACVTVGVPYGRPARGVTFHWSTRRTGATRMIQRGGEKAIAVVQRIGNWKAADCADRHATRKLITAEVEAGGRGVSALVLAPMGPKLGKSFTRPSRKKRETHKFFGE